MSLLERWRERPSLDRLSARDRRAIRLGLLVFVPVLLWIFAVRPYAAALIEARDQLAAERALLAREEGLLASAHTLPDALAAAEQRAEEARARLVHAPSQPLAEARITEWLEQIAGLSHALLLELRAMSMDEGEVTPAGLQPILLAVDGESDLDGAMTFLLRVEQSPLLLRVREMRFEPEIERPRRSRRDDDDDTPSERRTTGVVRFTLIIEAYAPAETTRVEATPGEETSS